MEGESKNRNLILYICERMQDRTTFGSIVLAKVLYFSDHAHYLEHGSKISSFDYIKQGKGPTPRPNQFLPLRSKMLREGEVEAREVEYFGKPQKRLVPKVRAELKEFTPEEVRTIDAIIATFADVNGKAASDVAHQEPAWEWADDKEDLPAFTYLLSRDSLTQDDIDWGNRLKNELAGL